MQYNSDTPPSVTWKHEGKEVATSPRNAITNESGVATLKLTNAVCSTSGQYSVRLENKHGSEESRCQLIVVGM